MSSTTIKVPDFIELEIPLAEKYIPTTDSRAKLNGIVNKNTGQPVYWSWSEKYDGNRAYYMHKYRAMYTRSGHNLNMPKEFMKDFPKDCDLDGEIFSEYGDFSRLAGLLNTKDKSNIDWTGVKYMVFDRPTIVGQFFERMPHDLTFKAKNIIPVPYTIITSFTNLEEILEKVEEKGGEGLILRNINAEYERKRSKNLLKYVSSFTAEATVTGIEIGKGRNSDRMGALLVTTQVSGLEINFNIGTGFNDYQRDNAETLFPIGTIVTFKYREITKTGKPRFPSFLRIRNEL